MNFKVISSSKETLGGAKQILLQQPDFFSKPVTELPTSLFYWTQKVPFCWSKLGSLFFLLQYHFNYEKAFRLNGKYCCFSMQAILQQLSVFLIYYLRFSLFRNKCFFFCFFLFPHPPLLTVYSSQLYFTLLILANEIFIKAITPTFFWYFHLSNCFIKL